MIRRKHFCQALRSTSARFVLAGLLAAMAPIAAHAQTNGPIAFFNRAVVPGTLTVTGTQTIAAVGDCSNVQVTVAGDLTGTDDDGGGLDQVRFELWDDGTMKDSEVVAIPVGATQAVSVTMSFLGLYQTGAPGVGVYLSDLPSETGLYSVDPFFPTDVAGTCPKCGASPRPDCNTAQKSQFQYKDKDPVNTPEKRKLTFKFTEGAPDELTVFGNPTVGTEHTLCIYENGSFSAEVTVPAGASWSAKGSKGFKYKDKTATDIQKALLKAGAVGTPAPTGLRFNGKGAGLPSLALPLAEPLTVQIINNSNASCFSAEFTTAKKNDQEQYKAKQ